MRTILSITETALGSLDLDHLLRASLDKIADELVVDTAAVLLLSEDGLTLVARAAHGLEEEVQAGVRIPVGQGFAGRIAAERKPVVLDDVAHSDVLNPILREKGIRSLVGVPLLADGRVLGVLHVGTLTATAFNEADVQFLELIAARIASAIEHARLYEAAHEARSVAAEATEALHVRDEFLIAQVDTLRFEQVVMNLLDNAVKYSPKGGAVEVTLARTPSTFVLSVRDHGVGVAPEHLPQIFDRFYQAHRNRSGLGLGLYISRQIVERHGGMVYAEAPPDGGTRFVVSMSLAATPRSSSEPPASLS